MKASRFSDAQKAFILKQAADGMPVADVCRKAGISQATYLNFQLEAEVRWAVADQVRRLKQLENQNANLKKALADLNLDKEMLQGDPPDDFEACPEAQAVDAVCGEWDVSIIRCACRGRLAKPSVAPALSMPDRLSEAPSVTVACGVPLLSRKPLYPVATSFWTIPTWPRF